MSTLERRMRIVGGAGKIFGARPNFEAAGKTGTTLAKAKETVEALAGTGTGVKVPVRVKNTATDSAIEAATAKPTQTADDLVSEMRGSGGYESNQITNNGGTKMPKVRQPFEVSPSLKPSATNRYADKQKSRMMKAANSAPSSNDLLDGAESNRCGTNQ